MRTFFLFMVPIVGSVMATVVFMEHADARRLGGGRSFGGKSTFSSPYKRLTPSHQTVRPVVTPAQQKNAQLRQSLTTDGIYREIERQFHERHGENRTEILKLNAELLEIQAVN
jgi:hypothetical protein